MSSTSPSTSLTSPRPSASATNSRRPVRKSSRITTSTPFALSRSVRLLPMNPAPPVMQARLIGPVRACLGWGVGPLSRCASSLQREARGNCVAVEHPHRLQGVLLEALAEAVELLQQIVGDRNDVATHLVSLHQVEDLPRGGPD